MAISKIVYKESPEATPEVWMDVTQKTVTSASMLNGVTALKNDGTGITGNIASKTSSDLTASGATVTAPAGYYASSASKSVSSGSATTPATTVTANPSISVSSGGLITATASATKSVTPTVSAGYVSSGTAGTITVSGSNTSQLTTQAAQTIYPSTSDQTVASGKYLTGAQTIKGVLLTNLSAGNIKKDVVVKVGDSADDDRITSVTGTYEGGGGSNYSLLHSEDIEISTTSTSSSTIKTISLDHAGYFSDKILYVKVRDKAGPRNGYFCGSDMFLLNYFAANSPGGANTSISSSSFARLAIGVSSSGAFSITTTNYGVYVSQVNLSTLDSGSLSVAIGARYNSGTGAVDGTFNVSIYALDYAPAQGNPFDYSYS